jgi:protein-S-isoprenylcysteine O-methyltransferase Ste14
MPAMSVSVVSPAQSLVIVMLGVLLILFGIAAFVLTWLLLMMIRSPCPSCGRHHVIRTGSWLYPRFYCADCRCEWYMHQGPRR